MLKRSRVRFLVGIFTLMTVLVNPIKGEAFEANTKKSEAEGPELVSPSAVLMEASTGQIIYEKEAEMRRSPASITKIMTMLLIFENLKVGNIHLQDEVTTSAYAKSMGGSQVFLEEGEVQTVDTLIKCIAVASGNDASVAMAEHIAGSEEAFVDMMNKRAEELGMQDTHFVDCCGLTASEEHYTTAKDVAIMSRALINAYPEVYQYTKIWMEDIVHSTKKGDSTFTLSSTNKLLKQYEYTTGLKTGSTDKAKYCFCATASKEGIDLIAVIMGAPDYKVRFAEAKELLEYGFSCSSLYFDENREKLPVISVKGGKKEQVPVAFSGEFRYLDLQGNDISKVEKKIILPTEVEAPVEKGMIAGKAVYTLNGKELGKVDIIFSDLVEKADYTDALKKIFVVYFNIFR